MRMEACVHFWVVERDWWPRSSVQVFGIIPG